MGFGGSLICSFMILTIISNLPVSVNGQGLSSNVYASCSTAKAIVRGTMGYWSVRRPNIVPEILKLQYSDCFVEGCDGSVLIEGPNTERTADGNRNLNGFRVIEDIKTQLEFVCPGIVSCADILAIAARDAVVLRNGPSWDVKIGRLDGRDSLAANVKNLPSINDTVTVLLSKFAAFGLNTLDFVTMFGGPMIEKPACTYMSELIYKKTQSNNARPLLVYLEKQFVTQLRGQCFFYYLVETPQFHSFSDGGAVLKTDLSLLADTNFYRVLRNFVTTDRFKTQFARAMDKMSQIGLKTGFDGVVSHNCSYVVPIQA